LVGFALLLVEQVEKPNQRGANLAALNLRKRIAFTVVDNAS